MPASGWQCSRRFSPGRWRSARAATGVAPGLVGDLGEGDGAPLGVVGGHRRGGLLDGRLLGGGLLDGGRLGGRRLHGRLLGGGRGLRVGGDVLDSAGLAQGELLGGALQVVAVGVAVVLVLAGLAVGVAGGAIGLLAAAAAA